MQNVQDCFAKTLNITILSVTSDDWLTQFSNPSEFCHNHIRNTKEGYRLCAKCHRKQEKKAAKKGEPIDYVCHAGIKNFVIPIQIENQYVASILCGQFLNEEPDEEHFKEIAKKFGINEKECLKAVKKLRIIPDDKVKQFKDLLYLVVNSIAAISYANNQLAKSGATYKIPQNAIMEKWLIDNFGNNKRPITGRESEVLKLIVAGKNNKEIAQELFISTHTVKAHVSSILEKYGVEDRLQLSVKAVTEGLPF